MQNSHIYRLIRTFLSMKNVVKGIFLDAHWNTDFSNLRNQGKRKLIRKLEVHPRG